MAEHINPNPDEIREEQQPSIEGAGKSPMSGFSKLLKSTRAYVVAGMPVILGSCGGIVEDGKQHDIPAVEQAGPTSAPEVAEREKRHVHLFSDTAADRWYFKGNYSKDFRLVVYVDGKQVSNQVVTTKDGAFQVSGIAGENVGTIDVQAFEADAPFEKAAEIPITLDANSQGMFGSSHFQSGPMQSK